MAKQKTRVYALNRNQYKTVKKYDHQQMEDFCAAIYEGGVKAGREEGRQEIKLKLIDALERVQDETLERVLQAAAKVKGIGPKKLEEIRSELAKMDKEDGLE